MIYVKRGEHANKALFLSFTSGGCPAASAGGGQTPAAFQQAHKGSAHDKVCQRQLAHRSRVIFLTDSSGVPSILKQQTALMLVEDAKEIRFWISTFKNGLFSCSNHHYLAFG